MDMRIRPIDARDLTFQRDCSGYIVLHGRRMMGGGGIRHNSQSEDPRQDSRGTDSAHHLQFLISSPPINTVPSITSRLLLSVGRVWSSTPPMMGVTRLTTVN